MINFNKNDSVAITLKSQMFFGVAYEIIYIVGFSKNNFLSDSTE